MDLKHKAVSLPGRGEVYVSQDLTQEPKRLPFSCVLLTLGNQNFSHVIRPTMLLLKAAAGVKIIIPEDFRLPEPRKLNVSYLLSVEESEANESNDAVYYVEDSLSGISTALGFLETAVMAGMTDIVVDLSGLRPAGTRTSSGNIASGAESFKGIFELLVEYINNPSIHTLLSCLGLINKVVLKGGYKKGVVTSAIHVDSPYLEDYLNVPLVELEGAHKKGIIVTEAFRNSSLFPLALEKINTESLFLQKEQPDKTLYANVCQGILLKGVQNLATTCMIVRINLGLIESEHDLIEAYVAATDVAINLTLDWRRRSSLSPIVAGLDDDNQVAICTPGLANMLNNFNMSYEEFMRKDNWIYKAFCKALKASCEYADKLCDKLRIPKFDRLHTVEPAQTHSFRLTDAKGYTVVRGIWTPWTRYINRVSDVEQQLSQRYDYGEVELKMSPEKHFELCNMWQEMMDTYGRSHAISYDTWEAFSPDVYDKWYSSSLRTLYYNEAHNYNNDYSRKRIPVLELPECDSCVSNY